MVEDEHFWLLCDTDENENLNDESSKKFDDNNQMSLEDKEDAVKENCEGDVDFIYNIDDMNELDESNTNDSTTEECTDKDENTYEARNFRWSKIPS